MFKKIVIATDGSEQAGKAVFLGSEIAALHDAEVILVHVMLHNELSADIKRMAEIEHLLDNDGRPLSRSMIVTPPGHLGSYMALDDGDGTTGVLRAIGEQILSKAEQIAREQGAKKISKRLIDGKPSDAILEVVKAEKADLIVSGARGLSDFAALLLGSVSHRLARHAPVTCVTVR